MDRVGEVGEKNRRLIVIGLRVWDVFSCLKRIKYPGSAMEQYNTRHMNGRGLFLIYVSLNEGPILTT